MADSIEVAGRSDDGGEGPPVINVVRIKLTLVLRPDDDLIELHLTSSTGIPARMTSFVKRRLRATADPQTNCDVVSGLLIALLEEYSEPF